MSIFKLVSVPGVELWNGTHTWRLPRVEDCPHCGNTWINSGIAYPQIDLSGFANEKRLRGFSLGPFVEWKKIRNLLRSKLPSTVILEPGTQFGALHAELRGKPTDLTIDASTYALLANATAEAVLDSKVAASVRADIRTPRGERLEYYELALPYVAEIDSSSFERLDPQCPICGHQRADLGKSVRLVFTSVPENAEMFRARNWPSEIFLTDESKNLIVGSHLTGVSFEEVEVR